MFWPRLLALWSLSIALFPAALLPQEEAGCFAIVVGARASADGAVLFGHNEDTHSPGVFHWRHSRQTHPPGSRVRLVGGGWIDQVPKTHGYIWSQIPGFYFSDFYLNDRGLAIASNACPSREREPEITGGGIGFKLRRLLAMRARTAREAVELAGSLLGEWGYTSSGRTLILADPSEAWLLCKIHGKHWLAVRVPDDQVVVIANSYPVHEIELDQPGVLASPGLLAHALERGFHDPTAAGPFQFALAFADERARLNPRNFERQRRARRHLGAEPGPEGWKQPLFFSPARPLTPADLFRVLRDRGDDPAGGSATNDRAGAICVSSTINSKVFQLRRDLPVEIGACLWLALGRPDASLFVPWHLGSLEAPRGYGVGGDFWKQLLEYNLIEQVILGPSSPLAFDAYRAFRERYDQGLVADWSETRQRLEARWIESQPELEQIAVSMAERVRRRSRELLTKYAHGCARQAQEAVEALGRSASGGDQESRR